MFDDSEQQQISHLSRQIIVPTPPPSAAAAAKESRPVAATGARSKGIHPGNTLPKMQHEEWLSGWNVLSVLPSAVTGTILKIPSPNESFWLVSFFSTFGEFRQETSECPKKKSLVSGSSRPAVDVGPVDRATVLVCDLSESSAWASQKADIFYWPVFGE